jgi:DinB family protein
MASAGPVTRDVLSTFEDVRCRGFARLDGLTDAEYLWEPVTGGLTVRAGADGTWRADALPPVDPEPAPFTTIAWRSWHIGSDCLRGYLGFFDDDHPGGDPQEWPGTAAGSIAMLAEDWARFRSRVELLGDDRLLRPMAPRGGSYSHERYLLLVLHALDEAAHHFAEIGVLRDLYRHGFRGGQPR